MLLLVDKIFSFIFLIQKLLEVAPDMKYIILGIDYDMLGYSLNTTNQVYCQTIL